MRPPHAPALALALALLCAALIPPAASADDGFFEPADYAVLSIEKVNDKPFVARIRHRFTGRVYDYVPGDALGPAVIRQVTDEGVTLADRLTKRTWHLPVPHAELERKLMEKARDQHKVLFDEARRLYKVGQARSASERLKEAVALAPGFKEAHLLLAIIYHEHRLYKDAFRHYRETVSIDPKAHRAFYNMAQMFFETNNFNEALYYLRRALAVKPDYEKALNLYSAVQDEIELSKKSRGSMQSMQERERQREKIKSDMQRVADEIRELKADLEELRLADQTTMSANERKEFKEKEESLKMQLGVKEKFYEIQSSQLQRMLEE